MSMPFVNVLRCVLFIFFISLSGCSVFTPKPVVVDTQETVLGPIDPILQQGFGDALALLRDKKFEEAEVLLLDLTATFPAFAGPWTNLAIAQGQRMDFNSALSSINNALAVDAKFCQAVAYKGVVLRELGQFKKAKDQYLVALACNPNDHLSLYNLGVLSDLYLHDNVAALDYYQRYIQTQGPEPDTVVQSWIVDLKRRIPDQEKPLDKAELPAEADTLAPSDSELESLEPQLAGEQ